MPHLLPFLTTALAILRDMLLLFLAASPLLLWLTTGHSIFYWLLRLLTHAEACQQSLGLACRAFYHEYRRSYPQSLRRVRRVISRPHEPPPSPVPPSTPVLSHPPSRGLRGSGLISGFFSSFGLPRSSTIKQWGREEGEREGEG